MSSLRTPAPPVGPSASSVSPPAPLRPGDVVAVIAPAGPVPPDRLRAGLDRLAGRYRVRVDETVWQRHGYLAAPDAARAEALARALADPDVRAVLCARGGYGATRLLPLLDPAPLRADPKPIVGFSDVTALHAWALASGVGAVHGPVVTQLASLPEADLAHLVALLERPLAGGGLQGRLLLPARGVTDEPPSAGPLVGGNLALLASLAGTPWAPRYEGALVLLEEVGEAPYRIDRMITQLFGQAAPRGATPAGAAAAPFAAAAGFGIGDLAGCRADGPLRGQPTALAAVLERLAPLGVPVLGRLPFGHGARNQAWPVGALAELDPATGAIRWPPG